MKKNRIMIIAISLLFLVTAGLAALHLISRQEVPAGSILVVWQGKEKVIDPDTLEKHMAEGTLVNGKGEEKEISEEAVTLPDLFKAAGVDLQSIHQAVITASDEYSASYSSEEINGVYLIKDQDDQITAFIFGDPDAKRRIHNVMKVEAE